MKIIRVDNYDRPHIEDKLVASNITNKLYGKLMVRALNSYHIGSSDFFKLVEDDYILSRGMTDLV